MLRSDALPMPVHDASPIQALDVLLKRLQLALDPHRTTFHRQRLAKSAQRGASKLAAALAFRPESADRPRLHPARNQLALDIRWRPTVRGLCAPESRAAARSRIVREVTVLRTRSRAVFMQWLNRPKQCYRRDVIQRALVRRARRSRRDERRAKFFSPEIFGLSK